MTKSGGSKHQKRVAAPRNWVIARKQHTFAYRANPGPHGIEASVPLGILLRDNLKLGNTAREIRIILNKKEILIDGRIIYNPKFPVGLMDVIQIDSINKFYRVLPDSQHNLKANEMKKPSKITKACQIMNKSTIKGGITQLNLHDGRNIILPKEEGIERRYNTKDTLIIELPSQEIIQHIPFKEGMYAVIKAGRNVGKYGIIKSFQWRFGPRASTVTITSPEGEEVQTAPEYLFVIGEKSPWWDAKGDGN
ncbi:MAG TPA: 30S ribosomal protein S4e [Candidatus Bathyarchaeia archaeon]|nr:30S ribosomal protein S4e [Candidatus Bathyarchaeia archaeon]